VPLAVLQAGRSGMWADWIGGVSVEIRRRMVESIGGSCGPPFNGGDVYVGHTGAGEAFAESAGSKKDGTSCGQNPARRLACKVAAASFHPAGPIARTRVSRQARRGADRESGAGV